jgi:hypothetical protein
MLGDDLNGLSRLELISRLHELDKEIQQLKAELRRVRMWIPFGGCETSEKVNEEHASRNG